jgi:hypothetical protein
MLLDPGLSTNIELDFQFIVSRHSHMQQFNFLIKLSIHFKFSTYENCYEVDIAKCQFTCRSCISETRLTLHKKITNVTSKDSSLFSIWHITACWSFILINWQNSSSYTRLSWLFQVFLHNKLRHDVSYHIIWSNEMVEFLDRCSG